MQLRDYGQQNFSKQTPKQYEDINHWTFLGINIPGAAHTSQRRLIIWNAVNKRGMGEIEAREK